MNISDAVRFAKAGHDITNDDATRPFRMYWRAEVGALYWESAEETPPKVAYLARFSQPMVLSENWRTVNPIPSTVEQVRPTSHKAIKAMLDRTSYTTVDYLLEAVYLEINSSKRSMIAIDQILDRLWKLGWASKSKDKRNVVRATLSASPYFRTLGAGEWGLTPDGLKRRAEQLQEAQIGRAHV